MFCNTIKNKRNRHSLFLILMTLTLILMTGPVAASSDSQPVDLSGCLASSGETGTDTVRYEPQEPRVIFEPKATDLNQVLGLDFTMLNQGKSRLTITTDRKTPYDLDRIGEKSLLLKLPKTTIQDLLLKEIDASHFHGAPEKIVPASNDKTNEVSLKIDLKELVPFHVKQTDNAISIEFGRTDLKPPEKKIIPLKLARAEAETSPSGTKAMTEAQRGDLTDRSSRGWDKKYTGEPMYLDFADADVTNILRLINEISEENIIWDPAIEGRKVSMILKGVPWDQALELILKNNNLAKRYVGENIIWITTKAKMNQILAEEEAEERKKLKRIEEREQKIAELEKKKKEDEPLVTEFIPVDFADASEILNHITKTKRGELSVDIRTNTITITDTAESIEDAKKTVSQFDTPVKQIMIEARIVDASDNFTRDLGIKWNTTTSAWRQKTGTADVPPDATAFTTPGEQVYGGSFSTNAPQDWGNIGLNFASLTSSGLGIINLDASLALAESEGIAKTLSAPKVIAQEGTTSTIMSGETIYTNPTENVAQTSRDAALTLKVTPTSISYNGYVTMTIDVTDNKNVSPNLDTTKEIHTTLIVKTGDTIVIGGIIKESESNDVSGVPLLKDIPGLGWVFKANTKTKSKSELLVFLTPTMLPSIVKDF